MTMTAEPKPTPRLSDAEGVKMPSATYTADDVAALLQISTRQVWRMNDSGQIPAPFRIGRLVRWRATVIDQWLADGCPPCKRGR